MALVVYWYDFICFGIVGVAVFGSLYVLWRKEGAGKCNERTNYESLLVARPDRDCYAYAGVTPRGHVSSSQLWTSCWRGLHPLWLLALRLLSCTVLGGFLAWDILDYDASIFIYYTEWTFTLVVLYFAIGTIVSAHGCMLYYSTKPPSSDNGERDVEQSISTNAVTFTPKEIRASSIKLQSHYDQEAVLQRAGFWGYLMQTAYQTCAGAVILTDLVFWCIIVPFLTIAHFKLNMLMGCMHTLNAVFLLLDTSVNSLPFPWFRLSYFVLWSCCYVIFQWVIHACGFSWWPYPFLELSTPWAPLWYLCLSVVHIPCYGLYSLLVRAKYSIFSRLFPQAFVRPY
uniref:Uncharacterized protein n=2 Tax=Davidia involucrata TaxID=16924 RepID=A0A5B6Z2N5_DAVIN